VQEFNGLVSKGPAFKLALLLFSRSRHFINSISQVVHPIIALYFFLTPAESPDFFFQSELQLTLPHEQNKNRIFLQQLRI
jgi:hypothetical protein